MTALAYLLGWAALDTGWRKGFEIRAITVVVMNSLELEPGCGPFLGMIWCIRAFWFFLCFRLCSVLACSWRVVDFCAGSHMLFGFLFSFWALVWMGLAGPWTGSAGEMSRWPQVSSAVRRGGSKGPLTCPPNGGIAGKCMDEAMLAWVPQRGPNGLGFAGMLMLWALSET